MKPKFAKNRQVQAVVIVAIVIILLCYFMGCFQTEQVVTTVDTPSVVGSTASHSGKIGEHETGSSSINWDDCCSGFITVTLTYDWYFFHADELPDDFECDDPVIWTVTDSAGSAKYTSSEYEPNSETTTFRGHWDCMNPWKVTVENDCGPWVTYGWSMSMVCD